MAHAKPAKPTSIRPEPRNLTSIVLKRRTGNSKLRSNSKRELSQQRNCSKRLTPPPRISTKRFEWHGLQSVRDASLVTTVHRLKSVPLTLSSSFLLPLSSPETYPNARASA